MITFEECKFSGYKERTIQNASADYTIAFAVDFNTAGERLTKNSVIDQTKIYIPISVSNLRISFTDILLTRKLIFEKVDISSIEKIFEPKTLNIAGNGIYTLSKRDKDWTQEAIDEYVYGFLKLLFNSPALKKIITLIRSGGQTGFDEAGIKAAERLGIDSLVLAPKGWTFRGIDGVDISDEKLFKKRFMNEKFDKENSKKPNS